MYIITITAINSVPSPFFMIVFPLGAEHSLERIADYALFALAGWWRIHFIAVASIESGYIFCMPFSFFKMSKFLKILTAKMKVFYPSRECHLKAAAVENQMDRARSGEELCGADANRNARFDYQRG